MKLSVRKSLLYPFSTRSTLRRSLILLIFSFIPFFGTVLLSALAAAMVSVITMEHDERAVMEPNELLERSLRAIFASLTSMLYLLPALGLLSYIGFSFFNGDRALTLPTSILSAYILIVLSVWPLATLHAVTKKNVWATLALPRLLWMSLRNNWINFFKVMFLSSLLVILKTSAFTLKFVGAGFFLIPINAMVEYVFQYNLAKFYAGVILHRHH